MYHPKNHFSFSIVGAALLTIAMTMRASASPVLSPLQAPTIPDLPPGDTTILVIGAVALVLIVIGGVIWSSKRSK